MEDTHSTSDAAGTVTPDAPEPTVTAPKTQSPIDQTRDMAKKILAMITGHSKN